MVKQRWEERNIEEREGEEWSEEWEVSKAEASKVKDSNNVDFAKKKATEIPTDPRLILPKQTNEKAEKEMRNLTGRLSDTFTNYREENCNDKGRIKTDNLTKEERSGL